MTSPAFPLQRLSTEDIPRRERMGFVHDFVGRHVGGLQFRPADRDNIRIDLEAMLLPQGLTVGRGLYSPTHGLRARHELQDGREHCLLTIHSEDHEVSVDGKEAVKIAAGDVFLVHEAVRFEFWQARPMSVDVVSLDRHVLASLAPRIAMQPSYIVPAASASLPLFAAYVEGLRRQPPASAKASEMASRHIYDLAALVLDGFVPGGAERDETSIAAARLKLVQKDIIERLADPDLGIEAVAQRQGVTPRYIQRLFESSGTTFSDFVRERRLQRALRLLESTDHALSTVTSIAYGVGFSDITVFNRAFRRRYDTTPTQVRAKFLTR